MHFRSHIAAAISAAALAAAGFGAGAAAQEKTFDVSALPGGEYALDPSHAYINFTYSHAGFSRPLFGFDRFDSTITLDPENLGASRVEVTIDPASIDSNSDAFNEHLMSADMFDVASYPEITFISTDIERESDEHGKITGDLTMHGVTRPVTLDVTFHGSAPHFRSGAQILGFSAIANIKRSDWGLGYGVPLVGDDVTIYITAEYAKTD